MAANKSLASQLKGLPKESAAMLGRQLAGLDIATIGKVRIFPKGIPVPEEWIVSVLPPSQSAAKKLIDTLVANPSQSRFEVFPYGIVDPEIGRIDIGIPVR